MTLETFLALLNLALIAACTPGPNNLMLVSSGANFGLRRTLPLICGAGFGVRIRRLLSTNQRPRIFNVTMGLLIASFVIVLFRDEF